MSEVKSNATFIERMFDRFFSAQSKDIRGFFIVLLSIYSCWITWKYIDQNDRMNDRIVEEVRKQIPAAVTREVEPIKAKVDTSREVIREMSTNLDSFINKNNK